LLAFSLTLTSGVLRAETIHLLTHPFDPAEGEPAIESWLRAADAVPGEAAYYLVQLTGPPTDGRKAAVESAGGDLIAYVPDNAWIVRMDAAARDALVASVEIAWIGPYHPAYKLSPTIGTHELFDPTRAADSFLTLRVRVFDDLVGTAAAIEALGAEVLEISDDGFQKLAVVHASPALVPAMAGHREVWWIEEKPEFFLMNDSTEWVVQSNVPGSTPIWQSGIHGEGQVIAVMDSGLDYNSCWFREVGGAAPGPTHRKVIDYSLYGGYVYDGCTDGHGTHVCGTLAGDQSYINPGNYDYNGMAYKAKLALQDVGQDDDWSCTTGQVVIPTSLTSAYTNAYNLGARVHSNSWGGGSNEYDTYCGNIDAFMWAHPDFLVVFAAGNSGPSGSTVTYPGTAKNCVTVGATRRATLQHQMAGYSSRGPAHDGRLKPTVTAPGGEAGYAYINSANNNVGNPPAQTCAISSSPFQGTSMATPAVAGCAALARQYFTEGWYPSGTASPADEHTPSAALMKAVIVNSADDMFGSGSPPSVPNNDEGWGRVLLDDALYFDGDARELIADDVTPGVGQGGTEVFEFEVDTGAVPLEIVLVWTDYTATSGCAIAIQNNLDLTVTSPGGTAFKGNVFVGGQSVTGGAYDARNVEEVVRLASPDVGVYTVEVAGTTVPHAPQPFALVSTGSFANWPSTTGIDGRDPDDIGRPFEFVSVTPNPFNPSTTVTYRLFPVGTGTARATLRIYSVDGRLVRTLVDRVQDPGRHVVTWDGRDADGFAAASGVYFCELGYGGEIETRKVTLLK
jgi:hypothetical protein